MNYRFFLSVSVSFFFNNFNLKNNLPSFNKKKKIALRTTDNKLWLLAWTDQHKKSNPSSKKIQIRIHNPGSDPQSWSIDKTKSFFVRFWRGTSSSGRSMLKYFKRLTEIVSNFIIYLWWIRNPCLCVIDCFERNIFSFLDMLS